MSDGKQSTRTVDRALCLLEQVIAAPHRPTLSDLARACELSPATASRLLGTLQGHDFVTKDENGRFSAGPEIMRIGVIALRGDPLYTLSGERLSWLANQSHETASVAVLTKDDDVLYIRQELPTETGRESVRTVVWTGRTIPSEGTALGMALTAKPTKTGYYSSARKDSDIVAVAAPVIGASGEIVCALSINAPSYRTDEMKIADFGTMLLDAARTLSLSLGADEESISRHFSQTRRE